ncbi:MAG TPA: type II toxin-antitoxin system VapC family toxin [Dehalococcoidia bacterium]|nr:type II toxin-antitoxin system VapC family toxin [Dehalococcoidia bacterium]
MITAVDTNVLLDVLIPGAPHGEDSERVLGEAVRAGALVISEPVYAELAVHFAARGDLDRFLADTSIRIGPSDAEALYTAGRAWSEYLRRRPASLVCSQCGALQQVSCVRCGASMQPRQHVVADFLIGAHALLHAGRLLTRDRGFYAKYFPGLKLG